jgi:hypothetical protein
MDYLSEMSLCKCKNMGVYEEKEAESQLVEYCLVSSSYSQTSFYSMVGYP